MSKNKNIVIKNCLYCHNIFEAKLSEVKRGYGKFCNRSCSSSYTSPDKILKPNCICVYCKKEFYRNASKKKLSRSGLYFCCRKHKDMGQRLESGFKEIHPPHYGNGSCSYRAKALKEFPHKCNRCGWNEYVGALEVHHIDENRKNNIINNLEILCPNCHMVNHLLKSSGRYGGQRKNNTCSP